LSALLCDTSGLIAFFDAGDAHHGEVTERVDAEPGPFVVSPYVLAEVDYLLGARRGVAAELAALRELSGGAWELACLNAADIQQATNVIERYSDQEIGLADASLVVLAGRYKTDRLLTLDHRHFRVLRTLADKSFAVLP
jgi:predicted nucleic acid-binding protein